MRRVEITFPRENKSAVEEVLEAYEEEPVFLEAEREKKEFLRCEVVEDATDVDDLIRDIRQITDIAPGDLIIETLDHTTRVKKGEKQEGGSGSLSHYEMYTRAFNYSSFDNNTWALIALSAVIAVVGLSMQNVIVVIGAMVIAPILGPFVSNSFGLVVGDQEIIRDSVIHGVASILLAVLTAFVIGRMFPVPPNPLIRLVSEPGFGTIPLSLAVGSAAALAFSSEARESMAGVAVAIALVPPAASAGLMLANLNLAIFFDVSLILVSNTMSLILAGSVTFKLLGIEPDTWHRQNISKQSLKKAISITSISILLIAGLVSYMSYQDLQKSTTKSQVQDTLRQQFGTSLLQHQIHINTDAVAVNVTVVDTPVQRQELHAALAERIDKPVRLHVTELATVDR